MVLSLTTARAKQSSKIMKIGPTTGLLKHEGYRDVWDYVHKTLLRLCCSPSDQYIFESENQLEQVPPFACSIARMANSSHLLAVVDEDGFVTLFNTRRSTEVVKVFRAHKNAVFDVAWASGRNQLVTASGDQMAGLWDVVSGTPLGIFRGHSCSLKSVCFRPGDSHVFATGARDGNILVWDTRCNNRGGSQAPNHTAVNVIREAHAEASKMRSTPSRKRSRMSPSLPMRGDNLSSVTVVNFQDDMSLFSAGATDSTIKVWDLRKCNKGMKKAPSPKLVYPYAGSSIKNGGFSSLVFNSTRSEFFASCTDDIIYRYSTLGSATRPMATYSGHQNSSFYVKSSLSRDDGLLLSGSRDGKAYVWNVDRPHAPPVTLCGHEDEVTMVTWAEDDFPKVITGADDASIRIWRLHNHENPPTRHQALDGVIGHAEQSQLSSQMKENLPPTPPRPSRSTSYEPETWNVASTPPTTPTTPKPPSRTNSSISDWLKNSPKANTKCKENSSKAITKCKENTQDVENYCPKTDAEKQSLLPQKAPMKKLTVLGTCSNLKGVNNVKTKVSGLERIIIEEKLGFELKDLKSSPTTKKDVSTVLMQRDSAGEDDLCCDILNGGKCEILDGVAKSVDSIKDEQMDMNLTADSRSKAHDDQQTVLNGTWEMEPIPVKSKDNSMDHQSSAVKCIDSTSHQKVLLDTSVIKKINADLRESHCLGRKRKRKESAEELMTTNKNLKSENQNCDSSELAAEAVSPGLIVRQSRSLDSQRDTKSRGRGSLTSHAQHQMCTCSCSGNHRHPLGNLTAGSEAANGHAAMQSIEVNDFPDGISSGRETPKISSCNGSTRNICFYFRPHSREVKRSYSDSALNNGKALSTATPKHGK